MYFRIFNWTLVQKLIGMGEFIIGTFVWSFLKRFVDYFHRNFANNSTVKWIFNSLSKSVFLLLLGDGREHGGLGGVEGAGAAPVHLPVHLERLGDGGHGDLLSHLVNHLLGVALDHIIIIVSILTLTHLTSMGLLYWLISMGCLPTVVKFSGWGRWPERPWCCMAAW